MTNTNTDSNNICKGYAFECFNDCDEGKVYCDTCEDAYNAETADEIAEQLANDRAEYDAMVSERAANYYAATRVR